ncbi:hypothetical protein Q5H93_03940 [Hymenobacter sp. ASUV-10]|uniref:Glycosyltransferase RgtA/B/C/D-like domain-containing protein n=1 Tax=Hymenobacter aranciens TaxID=3063996 RepID=A0ABT9B6T9_9BACT|nr:hypothetical protein [Hymenobacter sp. ASUV-10]MDO7873872.1 hypothetical protein [Hymenobacter sp. ASUV-10]
MANKFSPYPSLGLAPARRQEALLVGGIVAFFAAYLLLISEYQHLYYDAGLYWEAGHRFYQHGHFSLLNYDDALRGYAYPLFNFLCLGLRKALHQPAVVIVKLANAGLAGLLFGVVGPRLWRAATGAAALPALGRRLLWAALGFLFWRDYFNFSLSDFPALLALGLALWQAQRRGGGAAVLAGLALALAVNIRPIYLAAVPPVLGLLLWQQPRPQWLPRLGLLAAGAALVLTPQGLINRRHFGANTPLVLSQSKELRIHNLYLQKLRWGLLHQKYESSVGRELPTGQLLFMDAAGEEVLQNEGIAEFATAGQYLRFAARHPLLMARTYARHLFAGLDLSHPTPYLKRWETSALLRGLNYSLWFGAGLVALAGWRRLGGRGGLVLAALLLPCLAVLPMSMEVRFLLPLHLLLLALVAFGRVPGWRQWRPGRWALVGGAYVVFLLGCFGVSVSITRAVEPRFQAYVRAGRM